MEPSDHEKQLGELEDKIDRLRALYEQYFMGIERLEPMTPRKEVDRRIYTLRKEPMRNTALRFRFNTLCQRFNTMQQHWGRITREIENGTYKRDIARAAARFGVEEALTAVGKKRAKSLAKVLEAQRDAQGGAPAGEAARREQERSQRKASDEYEAVSDADLVGDDDDAPTPPPLNRPPLPLPTSFDTSRFAPPPADPVQLARYGFGAGGGGPPEGQAAQAQPGQAQPGQAQAAQAQPAQAQPAQAHASSGQVSPRPPQEVAVARAPEPPAEEAPVSRKATGGLRLGGGRRAADPDAARRRLEELAEKIGAHAAAETPPPPAAAPRARFDPADVMASPVPASVAPPPLARPAAAPAPRDRPPTGDAPPSARPLGLRPPSAARPSSPSLEAEAARAATLGNAPVGPSAASFPAPPAPTAAARAEAKRDAASDRAGRREDLAEPRVREIYKEFVEAKRRSNESTASITYDKLADSLRKQVDKLKKEHTDRNIDFAVVTKDGKTMIKPIIK